MNNSSTIRPAVDFLQHTAHLSLFSGSRELCWASSSSSLGMAVSGVRSSWEASAEKPLTSSARAGVNAISPRGGQAFPTHPQSSEKLESLARD